MVTRKSTSAPIKSSFQKLDTYFQKHQNLYFYLSMAFLTIFSILLFDVRISEGGDDSGYLLSAKKFIEGESFPSYHGAFYSILIGWFIKLIGFKLIVFKLFSLLFLLGHQVFLYLALKDRVSPFVLISTLLVSSLCSGLIYFGSQTYTEAFFIFLQGAFLFVFFKYLFDVPNNFSHLKSSWPAYLAMGAIMLMIYTTRNVGIVTLLTILLYLLLEKKYIPALYTFGFYQVFSIPYGMYKRFAWGITETDMSGQLAIIMQKHPYNKALGTEDFAGIMTRIIENLKNYLSKIFLQQIGLKDMANNDTSIFVALLIVVLLLAGLVLAFINKNRVLKFLLLYLGMALGVTFVALHQMWAQARMIIVFIPLLLITLTWTFGAISRYKSLTILKFIPIILLTLITFKSFGISARKASQHQKVLSKNLSGNRYYGFTTDWVNYLKMSAWAARKVEADIQIASRKPAMSFIYGNGREFYPMYRLPIQYADSVMADVESSPMKAYFIKETELRKQTAQIFYAFKSNMLAGISVDNVLYGVYLIPEEQVAAIEQALDQTTSLVAIKGADDFRAKVLATANKTTAVIPDDLLNRLRENNVQYLIVGSLRVNPKMKTDRTINTVARYIAGIQLKYPSIAKQVHQIGTNENEPARLYKIELGNTVTNNK